MKLMKRLTLCWRILRAQPGNLLKHADRELSPDDSDEMQQLRNDQLRELILVFSSHGHSGASASYATSALERLLRFEPLRPLTGEPDEWNEIFSGLYQNKRCSRVFKDGFRFDGQAYDIDAVIFRDELSTYTNSESARPITFPYTPASIVVDRPKEEEMK